MSQREQLSYAMGVSISRTFDRQKVELDSAALERGLRDGSGDAPLKMTDEQMKQALASFQTDLKQKKVEAARTLLESQKQTSQKFLDENAKKEGVVVLPSGLQYKPIHAGTGPRPTAFDVVRCHYRGTLVDGTEFDSSYERGQPATFGLAAVITGWREALQLMPVGSRWQLVVPPDLAYGERGMPGPKGAGYRVPPNSVLVFEVELLGISAPGVEQPPGSAEQRARRR
ncbi:MAG TPA: FKBP-type peptidyl-prolyl cis-trans isomerase [Myxococcaceae bacterium]|nr:FKBP-type peptidyl-prolyl cis-trans isomerase [Myxococcaceae bacterium]